MHYQLKMLYFRGESQGVVFSLFCNNEEEIVEHVLLLCEWTKPVWFGLNLTYVPSRLSISRFDEWLLQSVSKFDVNTWRSTLPYYSTLGW